MNRLKRIKGLRPKRQKDNQPPLQVGERDLYALAKEIMSMPCNKNHTDKTSVYESQAAYDAYFRELKK